MSAHRTNEPAKDPAKSQTEGSYYLNLSRIVLRDRVCSPRCCVRQPSLGRYPRDRGAGWRSGYPKGSSSQQDSPLAKSTWLLSLVSRKGRTCGHSAGWSDMKESPPSTSPSFLGSEAPPDEGSSGHGGFGQKEIPHRTI